MCSHMALRTSTRLPQVASDTKDRPTHVQKPEQIYIHTSVCNKPHLTVETLLLLWEKLKGSTLFSACPCPLLGSLNGFSHKEQHIAERGFIPSIPTLLTQRKPKPRAQGNVTSPEQSILSSI